jgi:hypothetical protein
MKDTLVALIFRMLSNVFYVQATLEETQLNPSTIDDICVGGFVLHYYCQ